MANLSYDETKCFLSRHYNGSLFEKGAINQFAPDDRYQGVHEGVYIDTQKLQPVYSSANELKVGKEVVTFLKGDEQYCRYKRVVYKESAVPSFIDPWHYEEWMRYCTSEGERLLCGLTMLLAPLFLGLALVGILGGAINGNPITTAVSLIVSAGSLVSGIGAGRYLRQKLKTDSEQAMKVVGKECHLVSEDTYRKHLARTDREAHRKQFGELPRP